MKNISFEKYQVSSSNPLNLTFMQDSILHMFCYKMCTLLELRNCGEQMRPCWNKREWLDKIACFSFLRN